MYNLKTTTLDAIDIATLNQLDQDGITVHWDYVTIDDDAKRRLQEICTYGAKTGVSNFIYYSEINEFVKTSRQTIIDALTNDASDFGYSGPIELISNFNGVDDYSYDEIARCLYGHENDEDDFGPLNSVIAWYCLERTAQKILDAIDA